MTYAGLNQSHVFKSYKCGHLTPLLCAGTIFCSPTCRNILQLSTGGSSCQHSAVASMLASTHSLGRAVLQCCCCLQGDQESALEAANMLWLIQRDFLEGTTVQQMVKAALEPVDNPNRDADIEEVQCLGCDFVLHFQQDCFTGTCFKYLGM